jgi:hypothetical protein
MQITLDDLLTGQLGKQKMVLYLKNHPELFEDIVKISLTNKNPQCWRAAWMIFHCMEQNDNRLLPYVDSILLVLENKADGHQREFLKVLKKLDLTEDQKGILFNICMNIWEDVNKSPSVRGTAFETLLHIVSKYPELKGELEHLTQEHYIKTLSPGIKRAFLRMINSDENNN